MKNARVTLLALCGLMLAPPLVYGGGSRRSGNRIVTTITYTYRTYGS